MVKCAVRVVTEKDAHGYSGMKACGKKATSSATVRYSELHPHRSRETRMEDTFPLCRQHRDDVKDVSWWAGNSSYGGKVHGMRGIVASILVHVDVVLNKALDERLRMKDHVKSQVARMMEQGNAKILTVEDWDEVFTTLVREFTVRSVMTE